MVPVGDHTMAKQNKGKRTSTKGSSKSAKPAAPPSPSAAPDPSALPPTIQWVFNLKCMNPLEFGANAKMVMDNMNVPTKPKRKHTYGIGEIVSSDQLQDNSEPRESLVESNMDQIIDEIKRRSKYFKGITGRKNSLRYWLDCIFKGKLSKDGRVLYTDASHFATDEHAKKYLRTIERRTDFEVRALLLRFLVHNGEYGHNGIVSFPRTKERNNYLLLNSDFFRRSYLDPKKPWQGNTWVLDLLPHSPSSAIQALKLYVFANGTHMPDGVYRGQIDAMDIIRARYIYKKHDRNYLMQIDPIEFEQLIGALYEAKGFKVNVTKPAKDGGWDVEAVKILGKNKVSLYIQCKRSKNKIGVEEVRLIQNTARDKNGIGVLVTTSEFTKDARAEAETRGVRLYDFKSLNIMFNRHFGHNWHLKLSKLITPKKSDLKSPKP